MTQEMSLTAIYSETLQSLTEGNSKNTVMSKLLAHGVPNLNAQMVVDGAAAEVRETRRRKTLDVIGEVSPFLVVGLAILSATFSLLWQS